MIGFIPLWVIFSSGEIVSKMFVVIIFLVVSDLSPHSVGIALGSVANIAITIDCRVGYFLQKIGYFLHFRPFRAFFGGANVKIRGKCGKLHALSCFTRCDVVKNSAASNFYEMRRNLNFMARSFHEMPTRFSAMRGSFFSMHSMVFGLR